VVIDVGEEGGESGALMGRGGGEGEGAGGGTKKKRKTKSDMDADGLSGTSSGPLDYSDLKDVGTFDGTHGVEGKKVVLGRSMNVKEMCRVTLKDCVFAIEREPQMRGVGVVGKWMARIS
ncbi:hypothetical protein HDU98_007504, partial [Podochytrium sp. JEL0797]